MFLAGTILGAMVSAAMLYAAGTLLWFVPLNVRIGAVAVAAVASIAVDAGWLPLRFRFAERQIGQAVTSQRSPGQAFRFAFELGLGFRTYIKRTAPLVVAAVIFFHSVSFWTAFAMVLAYGLGRGAVVAWAALFGPEIRPRLEAATTRILSGTKLISIAAASMAVLGVAVRA